MDHGSRRATFCFGEMLVVAVLCAGCAPEATSNAKDRYIPAADLARSALEEVLVDWREGRAPEPIHRLAVGVHVVDKQRKKGQTLEEFEILGESPGDTARCFSVRVKLSGPSAEEKVRFVIIGIDPLWVFRQEDYESLSQWSCGKLEEEPATVTGGELQAGSAESTSQEPAANADAVAPPEASRPEAE